MIRSPLRHFIPEEFQHPDLIDDAASVFLDDVRDLFGAPLIVTSDARTADENAAANGSPTSLHLLGRAFDLRWLDDPEALWRLVDAVFVTAGERPVELELVPFGINRHLHLGLFPEQDRRSRLIFSQE